MLWQRVLTALVLIPLVVFGILRLDNLVFAFLLGGMVLVGAFEMARLARLPAGMAVVAYVAVAAAALWAGWHWLAGATLHLAQGLMALWWLLVTSTLIARRRELPRVDRLRPAVLVLGGLVLVTAWLSVVRLHAAGDAGPPLVLFLFVLIWVADSGAYFAGRAFGRTKLSPFVSPGKTWAGVAGAMLGALLCGAGLGYSGLAGDAAWYGLIVLCALVTMVSIGGDLWESRLKREAGVKDSGRLLPGHGGMLDRIDSLLAAAPVFAFGLGLLGGAA